MIKEFGSDIDKSLQKVLKEFIENNSLPSRLSVSRIYPSFKQRLLELDISDDLEIRVLDVGNAEEEEIDAEEEKIDAEEEKIDAEEKKIDAEEEEIKNLKEILNNFKATEAAYQNLSTDLKAEVEAKIQDSHYSSYKKTLAQELKSQGIEDPDYVDQYLRYYILEQEFSEKLAQEPHAQEFKSSYEKLQKSIGLSVATLHRSDPESISSKFLTKRGKALYLWCSFFYLFIFSNDDK